MTTLINGIKHLRMIPISWNWASQKRKTYRSSKFPILEIYNRKHSFTGREANPNFQTQTVDCYHQTYHECNGLKLHHHPSFSKLELGMCQLWVRLIRPSSQTYFRPTHQGHPRSQRAFCEHLIPITQLHSGYTIHILFLFYN